MIKNSKQAWEIGQTVKVGFLNGLTVTAKIATPGDYAPDAYILTRNESVYSFVPHNGLTKITVEEARRMVAEQKARQTKAASIELQRLQARERVAALHAELAA